jgi:hypothetical protein
MTGCIPRAPATIDEWLAIINACATAAGGPDWAGKAILGAETVAVVFLLAALVGALLARLGRA